MSEKTYTLAPLEWQVSKHPDDVGERWIAGTLFGSFHVESPEFMSDLTGYPRGAKWSCCFDEYYDEDYGECDTSDEAKAKCEQVWRDRILPMLVPTSPDEEGRGRE